MDRRIAIAALAAAGALLAACNNAQPPAAHPSQIDKKWLDSVLKSQPRQGQTQPH